MLKCIGLKKKESTAEYITQHQLLQGQERSDYLSGSLSGSQWDGWDHIAQEKLGINAAEWLTPNPSVMASLHRCAHSIYIYKSIYLSPDSLCGLLYLWHKQVHPQQPLTHFSFPKLPAMRRPDAPPHSAALTFDRESIGDHVPCRHRACLQPNLRLMPSRA